MVRQQPTASRALPVIDHGVNMTNFLNRNAAACIKHSPTNPNLLLIAKIIIVLLTRKNAYSCETPESVAPVGQCSFANNSSTENSLKIQNDDVKMEKKMPEAKISDSDPGTDRLKLAVKISAKLSRGTPWPIRVALTNTEKMQMLVYHASDNRDLMIRVFDISRERSITDKNQIIPTEYGLRLLHPSTVPHKIPHYTTSLGVVELEPGKTYEWAINDFEKYYNLSRGTYLIQFTAIATNASDKAEFSPVTTSIECEIK